MTCYRPRHEKNGFTLIEVVIVVAILVVVLGAVGLAVVNIMRVAEHESYSVDLEKDGYSTLLRVTDFLRPAVLPVRIPSGLLPDVDQEERLASPFRLLDSVDHGFGGAVGAQWWDQLLTGMNGLAFVVPVDIKGVGDFFDDNKRLQIGQARPGGIQALDTQYEDDGSKFELREDADASSLIHVDPTLVDDDSAGGDENADWPNAVLSSPAQTQAFTVIRYIPRIEGGQPAVVREGELGLDLDQDGELTGEFNIGRLQAVYVGGSHAVRPNDESGTPVQNVALPTVTVDFTGDVVLRNVNEPEPFFRLVHYRFADSAVNDDGIMAADGSDWAPGSGSDGVLALQIRLNLFDLDRYGTLRPTLFGGVGRDGYSAWVETVVSLRNMIR